MFNKFIKIILNYMFPNYYCVINNCFRKKIHGGYCYYHTMNKCSISSCASNRENQYKYCSYHISIFEEMITAYKCGDGYIYFERHVE